MARASVWSRIKSLWHKASRSLLGIAAMGLALGIGIGMGLWLGDVADKPPPRPNGPPPRATAPTPPQDGPRDGLRPNQPRIDVAPWVADPRRERPQGLDLPPERLPEAAPEERPSFLPPPGIAPDSAPDAPAPEALPDQPQQDGQQEGGLPAWRRYAVAPPDTQGRPLVAIVIDDMGVDLRHSQEAAALRAPLTLAYLPYARDLAGQTAAAHRAGHELMVHVSMQPQSKTGAAGQAESGGDPGPNALTVGLAPEEIRRRLDWALTQFPGFVGINNHMGSAFTVNRPGMSVVIGELKRRGLLFLDSRTTAGSVGEALAMEAGVPHATRHVFLDNIQSEAEARTRLLELERIAKARGAAIAIGHPHPTTLTVLREWLPTAAGRGLALVPLSTIVARNMNASVSAEARHENGSITR
ncbi:MAG TPA: divergent polysaccharide deacetylase family protein [Alphaproteobacteria bacterium]|nr:divergent polysaccharide deacetylase family protein [Alphaproteobacteria bacterium]